MPKVALLMADVALFFVRTMYASDYEKRAHWSQGALHECV